MDTSSHIALQALNNQSRLQILQWLKNPINHFPPQIDGDLITDGVCSGAIADKLGISAPALSTHMNLLKKARLVTATKVKGWVFYKRDEQSIQKILTKLALEI